MPTLRQLDYLVTLAETLHFRRAAERSNTTQSTLSLQLKALEDRLGSVLVQRTTSGVALTPVGSEVVTIARRMLRDAQAIRDVAKPGCKALSGVLRVGVPPTIGPSLLPRIIPKLREEFPALRLYVREDIPPSLARGLASGVHDVIIVPIPLRDARDASVTTSVLLREPLYLALPADHPLVKLNAISARDLAGTEILALRPAHPLHHVVLSLCERTSARLRFDYEGTSLDALRDMVAGGLGAAFLPGLYVRARLIDDPSIVVRDISDEKLFRTIALVWRASSPNASAFKRLAAIITTYIARELPEFAHEAMR